MTYDCRMAINQKAAILAYRTKLGARIRLLRKSRQESQRAFCERTGLNQPYLSLVEAGKKEPAITTLWRIAQGLEISVSELTDC